MKPFDGKDDEHGDAESDSTDSTASSEGSYHEGSHSRHSTRHRLLFNGTVFTLAILLVMLHHFQCSEVPFKKTLRYSKKLDVASQVENRCSTSPSSKFVKTAAAPNAWPKGVCTIYIDSTLDGSLQPSLHYSPPSKNSSHDVMEASEEARPLLVALHTWSWSYAQAGGGEQIYAQWAIDHDWHFVHPNFRGPNRTPESCGSEYAVQDIVDAVEFMKDHYSVDPSRIYLVGVSGGGHMATLMAGRYPEIWAGVSAWAPITDLSAWWHQRHGFGLSIRQIKERVYAQNIEDAVGGTPNADNPVALREAQRRSPVYYLFNHSYINATIHKVNLDINAGIQDGRSGGSVPFTHALHGFDAAVETNETIGRRVIEEFYATKTPPVGYQGPKQDILYGSRKIHYRKFAGNTRVTIFEGGHEIFHLAALNWLKHQRKGVDMSWDPIPEADIDWIESSFQDSQAGH